MDKKKSKFVGNDGERVEDGESFQQKQYRVDLKKPP